MLTTKIMLICSLIVLLFLATFLWLYWLEYGEVYDTFWDCCKAAIKDLFRHPNR